MCQHYVLLYIRVTFADNDEAKLNQSWLVVMHLCMPKESTSWS